MNWSLGLVWGQLSGPGHTCPLPNPMDQLINHCLPNERRIGASHYPTSTLTLGTRNGVTSAGFPIHQQLEVAPQEPQHWEPVPDGVLAVVSCQVSGMRGDLHQEPRLGSPCTRIHTIRFEEFKPPVWKMVHPTMCIWHGRMYVNRIRHVVPQIPNMQLYYHLPVA